MTQSNTLKTFPERISDPTEAPFKENISVSQIGFLKKFKTHFTKQQNIQENTILKTNLLETDKFDFINDFPLPKDQKKISVYYWIFGFVFLIVLVLLMVAVVYLYQSNKKHNGDLSLKNTEKSVIKKQKIPLKNEKKTKPYAPIQNLQKQIQAVNDYLKATEYQVARDEAEKITTLFDKEFSNNDNNLSPLRIQHYNQLSEIYYRLNNPQEAIFYSNKALRYTLKFFGKNTLETAKQYELMAFHLDNVGDFDKALKFRNDALSIRFDYDKTKIDQAQLVTDMNNLGEEYRTLGHLQESKKILFKAIHRTEEHHGIDAPELIVILNNLGLTYLENNQKIIGLSFLNQAYQIAYKHYGNEHELTRIITKNIARLRGMKI